jgi:uncharacterized protein YggE
MTFTVTPRRTALVLLAVIALTVVYSVGVTRSGGAPAAAATLSNNANASSTLRSSTQASTIQASTIQASTIAAIGGPGITVGGRASVAGTPDTLRLDLSVVATAPSVSEALASANRSAAAVQGSLLANGVQKKDLQTSGLNVSPNYDYSQGGTPRLNGYQASESVSAKLRDLGRAGDAIGKAVAAGGNAVRVNGVSLDLEDTGALVSSARDKAFAEAKAKAEQYAKAAGRTLGEAMSIAEDAPTASPIPMQFPAASSALDKASVPIQPGSQDVTVSVTVVFSMR